jgi:hypothetical protein
LGRVDEGEHVLARAITLAEDAHQYWTAGTTELYLGRSLLQRAWQAHDPQPAQQALTLLRRALQRMEREEDLSTTLSILLSGTLALALTGRLEQATRLRTAVHQHAVRYGLRPDRIDSFNATSETALAQLLQQHHQTSDPETVDTLTWPDMLALLTTEAS